MALVVTIFSALFIFGCLLQPLAIYVYDKKHLRRFPNAHPFSGLTNSWFAFEAWKGRRYATLQQKHQTQSGPVPVLRIGPNHLSFYSRQAIKDIHGHGTVMEKGVHYDLLAGTHRHLADVVDRSEHTRKRKMLASAFAGANLSKYDLVVGNKMREFVAYLDASCVPSLSKTSENSASIDYRRWTILYTQEVIAAIGLSADLGFLKLGDDLTIAERVDGTTYQARYRNSIEGSMHRDCVFSAYPDWFHSLVAITTSLIPHYRGYGRRAQAFSDIVRHLVRQRIDLEKSDQDSCDDLFSALFYDRKKEPLNLDFGELFAEANVILNAGSDSTGIAMTNTIFSLIQCPRALEQLRKELDEAFPDCDSVPTHEEVRHLPYLRACIDESMRMNAPSQFSLPRKTPPQGAEVAGYWIAGDVQVTTPTHAIHMDPTIWGDPDVFRPERWLGEEGKKLQEFFLVFSKGPRGCIGRNITYMEQSVMLATMARRYDFELVNTDFIPTRYETVSTIVDSLPIRLAKRP